jgi:hypothetical protein
MPVVSRLLLGVQQAVPRPGNLAQYLLAKLALRSRPIGANPHRLSIGRLADHYRIGLEEDNPQQAVEIGRLFMEWNPQPIEVWIE